MRIKSAAIHPAVRRPQNFLGVAQRPQCSAALKRCSPCRGNGLHAAALHRRRRSDNQYKANLALGDAEQSSATVGEMPHECLIPVTPALTRIQNMSHHAL